MNKHQVQPTNAMLMPMLPNPQERSAECFSHNPSHSPYLLLNVLSLQMFNKHSPDVTTIAKTDIEVFSAHTSAVNVLQDTTQEVSV
jgi:hypothetical protein